MARISQKRIPFSAALVLDTSLTMTGGPFAAARAAAETLIAGKLLRSELALIGFSARPYLVHDWSARERELASSLTGLKTSYGTALWDATVLASRKIRPRQGSARALVVLTDGRRDTTGTRVNAAIQAARRAGARVFVVIAGKGGAVQRSRLQRLAAETGGAFVNVRSIPELRRTFAALARTLSRQYLLSYSSPLTDAEAVVVSCAPTSAQRAGVPPIASRRFLRLRSQASCTPPRGQSRSSVAHSSLSG